MKQAMEMVLSNKTYSTAIVGAIYILGARAGLWERSSEIDALLLIALAAFLRNGIAKVETKTEPPKDNTEAGR